MLGKIVLRNADDSGWLIFEEPAEVLIAREPAEVLPVLIEAETKANEDKLFRQHRDSTRHTKRIMPADFPWSASAFSKNHEAEVTWKRLMIMRGCRHHGK